MKLTFIMRVAIITSILCIPYHVNADRMVRFLFNNGVTPSSTQICSLADNVLIDAIFALNRRRNLNKSTNTTRELWAAYCKDNCKGYATGTCRATNCVGYRRRELTDSSDGRALIENIDTTDRELQLIPCLQQISDMNQALDTLITTNAVSEPCKSFLDKTKRLPACYDDVIYGVVESVALWNYYGILKTPALITLDMAANGTQICKNVGFNFEAIVNTCVDFVRFTVVGPNSYFHNRTENDVPYAVYGDIGANNLLPTTISNPGQYKLTIVPDGFLFKQKVINFEIMDSQLERVALWYFAGPSRTATLVSSNMPATGTNICRSASFNVEAVTNACMSNIVFKLVGPWPYLHDRTESIAPFALFGDTGANQLTPTTLSILGEYTLTVTPDGLVSKQRIIKFTLRAC